MCCLGSKNSKDNYEFLELKQYCLIFRLNYKKEEEFETMACTSMSSSSSQVVTSPREILKEQGNLRRTFSGKDLCNQARIRRSHSDNHLCYSVNPIRASSTQPKLEGSHSVGPFKFHLPGSIVPKSLHSFLFEPETSKETNMEEDSVDCHELDEDVEMNMEEKEKKRANWVERLLEVQMHWRGKQQKDSDGKFANQDCDDEDGEGCEVDYNDEEGDGKTDIDRETFFKLLKPVSWSDTKIFSQLAFLCNMAYVIPEMKVCFLSIAYGISCLG